MIFSNQIKQLNATNLGNVARNIDVKRNNNNRDRMPHKILIGLHLMLSTLKFAILLERTSNNKNDN